MLGRLIGIKAEYIGTNIHSYEMPKYKDVIVYKVYEFNNKQYFEKVFGWVYERIIIKDNSFVFTIKHRNYFCELIIPIIGNEVSDLHALYLGPPVLVGTKYDTSKLHVDLKLKNGTIKVLNLGEYSVSDVQVNHVRNNIYEVHYAGLKDKFYVYGYKLKNTIDLDFKAFVIHNNGYEEDITDMFYELFYDQHMQKIYVTVSRMNKFLFESTYRLYLPKDSGLFKKYATEWIVNKDENNINITLNKVFNEEE